MYIRDPSPRARARPVPNRSRKRSSRSNDPSQISYARREVLITHPARHCNEQQSVADGNEMALFCLVRLDVSAKIVVSSNPEASFTPINIGTCS